MRSFAGPHFETNFTMKAVVAFGFSSMIQWPESGMMPFVTLVATTRRVSACAV